MKAAFLKKASDLVDQCHSKPDKMTILIKTYNDYLKHHPYDTEIWIKFALILYCFLKDNYGAIECLQTVLRYNPDNIYVTMLLVFISEQVAPMSDELFEKLCVVTSPHKEILSLIEYQKSWYYMQKNEELYYYALENSIELCDKFVWNHKALGSLYFLRNEITRGRCSFRKALKNIHHVYSFQEYQSLGVANIDEFFNARLKGTHIMQPVVLMMIDVLEPGTIQELS